MFSISHAVYESVLRKRIKTETSTCKKRHNLTIMVHLPIRVFTIEKMGPRDMTVSSQRLVQAPPMFAEISETTGRRGEEHSKQYFLCVGRELRSQ